MCHLGTADIHAAHVQLEALRDAVRERLAERIDVPAHLEVECQNVCSRLTRMPRAVDRLP